uniref:Uncharacterized protein n=1 Tax=Glossina brevipalpis TaxID=37001 RepID=A0A1A9WJP5_9MUSC
MCHEAIKGQCLPFVPTIKIVTTNQNISDAPITCLEYAFNAAGMTLTHYTKQLYVEKESLIRTCPLQLALISGVVPRLPFREVLSVALMIVFKVVHNVEFRVVLRVVLKLVFEVVLSVVVWPVLRLYMRDSIA